MLWTQTSWRAHLATNLDLPVFSDSTPIGGGGGGGGEDAIMRVATFFASSFAAFLFFESLTHFHVWVALRQDEKLERMEKEAEAQRVREELLAKAKLNETI